MTVLNIEELWDFVHSGQSENNYLIHENIFKILNYQIILRNKIFLIL